MSAKAKYTGVTLLSLLLTSTALSQPATGLYPGNPTGATIPDVVGVGPEGPAPGVVPGAPTPVPDPWITYPQPYCCGPVGGNGPIMMELYGRVGPAFAFGSTSVGKALGVGWEIGFGGRSLFFNQARDKAWTVDLGLSNAYNHANKDGILFTSGANAVVLTSVNRTFANIGLGQERWILHPVTCCGDNGWNWRWGYDGGFRYGTVRLDGNVAPTLPTNPSGYARFNNRQYGIYYALHTDLEKPCGCCTYLIGARVEWSYDWIGTFGSRSDIEGLQLLFTTGVRF